MNKKIKIIALIATALTPLKAMTMDLPSNTSACAHMGPILASGFQSAYYSGLANHIVLCSVQESYNKTKPNCQALTKKFNVDFDKFSQDRGGDTDSVGVQYRSYLRNISIGNISEARDTAVRSTRLMIKGLKSKTQTMAIDEMSDLMSIGSKVTLKVFYKSFKRMSGAGVCL